MTVFSVGASTHPGMIRSQNEDNYVADAGLYVVADGMGGHQAGEVASEIAVRTLREAKGNRITSPDDLAAAVRRANDAIRREAAGTSDQAGMGTTLTGLVQLDPGPDDDPDRTMLAVANVGDSRTYLWRHRRLTSISVDHSYVQELVSSGQITEQEARLHPRRNIVTRALGIDPNVRVDTWLMPAIKGDRFVVCSDGLVDEVPDHEIASIIDGIADPQRAAEELVAMANRHGGRDNVTVIVVDVIEGSEAPDDGLPEPVWAEGLPETTWADPDRTDAFAAPTGAASATNAPGTPMLSPAARRPRRGRNFGLPQLLFLVALGAIVTVVVVVALLAVNSDPDDGPAPTTVPSTVPTTSVAPTTTSKPPRTTTTTRPRNTTTTPRRTTTTAP